MFVLYQKCQFIYPKKVNSLPIRQFPFFQIFGHVACHMSLIHVIVNAQEDLEINLWGKIHLVLGSKRYCQSVIFSQHTSDPGLKPPESTINTAKLHAPLLLGSVPHWQQQHSMNVTNTFVMES